MKRKLTLAMLLSLSAASPMALALGLGEAEVRSTLNAPLRATIPLTDTTGIQPGLLNVSVADERAFAAAGLARTPLAAGVRLAVDQRQGRLVVDLTSERPVREPWLDLLLRFDWPGGQQLREITLLLDPPDYDQMPALVVGSRRVAAAPATAPAPSATPPAPVASPSAAPARAGDPAWVRSGDTLWAVAGRLRPDSGISMNQMMVALVEANPEAFPSGNINAMRAGFTLVVPSREAITARSGIDSDRVVAQMNQAWANRAGGAPARVPLGGSQPQAVAAAVAEPPPAEPIPAEPTSAVEPSETPPEVAQAEPAASDEAPGPRLTLLTDAEAAAQGAASAEGDEGSEVETASEGAGEGAGEGGEEPAAAPGSPQVMADPELLAALHGDGTLTSDERLVRLEAGWLESRQALEAVQEERDQLQEDLGEMREELAALRDQLAALAAGGAGADGPGAGGIAPVGGEVEDSPWWGAVYQGGLDRNLMLGGAGLAALLALWLVLRRRRQASADTDWAGFGEVRVATPGGETPVSPQAATVAAAPPASVQSSLPQAEAINEADIFIAYGRYDQARELLEASLAREPERDDLRLKLLKVHLEQGSREEAEQEAARLREGGNPAVRDEVARLMARPDARAAAGEAAAPPATAGAEDDRAVFVESAELPPRVFDDPPVEPSDAPSNTPPVSPGLASTGPASSEPTPTEPERYRRPAAPSAEGGEQPEHTPPVSGPSESGQPDPAPPSEPPEVVTRRRDDGSEFIDYRPPTLDPSPAPREETPMQPSVEFTPAAPLDDGAGQGAEPERPVAGRDVPGEIPEEWEVEEVAFPPLRADNVPHAADATPDGLAEAQRLIADGRAAEARDLLGRLSQDANPMTREEAKALLNRLNK
jgi:pilus assembly protein FimV